MQAALSRRGFIAASVATAAAATAGAAAATEAKAAETPAEPMDRDGLNAFLKDHANFGAAVVTEFLPGAENAPTDEDLEEILQIANSYMYCHILCAPHFVVVRDPEEQAKILGAQGITGDGTVTILVLADGCKDQEHHKDEYTLRDAPVHYWDMYYALDEVGQAKALLNLAAVSKGYRIRNFGAMEIPNISFDEGLGHQETGPLFGCGGSWELIRYDNWDIQKYCHGKDGSANFRHWTYSCDKDVDLDGNLTLLYALAIGKVDEDAVATSVTHFEPRTYFMGYPQDQTKQYYNYAFWDTGKDGIEDYVPDPAWEEAYAAWEADQDETAKKDA